MKPKATLRPLLALAGCSMMALSTASAQTTYYWDGNDATAGFGTAGGTWSAPTAGTATSGWSTSSTGVTAVNGNSVTTTIADTVNFGNTGTGNMLATGIITVSGTVNVGTIGSANPTTTSQTYTLSGGIINFASAGTVNMNNYTIFSIDSQITGASTSLTKLGTGGTLRLNNANNSYTGVNIIAGTLEAAFLTNGGLNSSIGTSSSAASNLVLGSGNREGYLSYVGATNTTTNRLMTLDNANVSGGNGSVGVDSSGNGAINFTNTGTVAIVGTSTRTFRLSGTNAGNNIFNPLLGNGASSALSVNKRGTGTWILANNSNSYTGTTTLEGGNLVVTKMADYGTVSPIGRGTAGQAIAFAGGGLVYTGTGDDTNRVIQVSANSGSITNNGSGALNFTATTNFNVAGSTTSARSLFIGGTNGGTISGAIVNNNTGAITVSKFGSGTWTLAAQNSYTGTTDLQSGTLQFQSGASNITQTLGALRNRIGESTLVSNKAGTGSLSTTFSSYTRDAGGTGNIISTGGTYGTDNSVFITGSAGFINAGLYFNGSEFAARSGTGLVRALNYATTGGDADTVDGNTVTASKHVKLTSSFSGAGVSLLSLNLQGSGVSWTNSSSNLTVPGIIKSGGGSQSTISGGIVNTSSNAELVIRTDASSDSLLISSVINSGSGMLTKSGEGTLTLSATNTYTGQTNINAGTLSISSNANLGNQTTGATLNLKGGTLQVTADVGLFNGTAGTNNRAVTLLNQSNIEVTGSNTLTIAGVVSNNAGAGGATPGFNKTGTGSLILSGANTYNGATNVNEGTLLINGSTSTSSAVTVASGATLGGSGTVGGATTVDGALKPGNSTGLLNVGSLNLNASASTTLEINGTNRGAVTNGYDAVGVNTAGTIDLGGALIFEFGNLSAFAANTEFDLFSFDTTSTGDFTSVSSTGFYAGTWSKTGDIWSLTDEGQTLNFSEVTGNLVVVPEPRAALLGGLGLLVLLRRRRG